DTDMEIGETKEIAIGGVDGVAVDIQGQFLDSPTQGMAFAVSPFPDILVFGLANSFLETDENLWQNQHKAIFEEFIETIKFVDVTGVCIISTDDTYGYTEENPIKVGGSSFDGPSRERAYLDNLLGPNGESLSYE